jgi:hypothetical protein
MMGNRNVDIETMGAPGGVVDDRFFSFFSFFRPLWEGRLGMCIVFTVGSCEKRLRFPSHCHMGGKQHVYNETVGRHVNEGRSNLKSGLLQSQL